MAISFKIPSDDTLNEKLEGVSSQQDSEDNMVAEASMPKPPPSVLLLKRRAMRMYPDNRGVALYYAEALGKHISIPFGGNDMIVSEEIITERKKD